MRFPFTKEEKPKEFNDRDVLLTNVLKLKAKMLGQYTTGTFGINTIDVVHELEKCLTGVIENEAVRK